MLFNKLIIIGEELLIQNHFNETNTLNQQNQSKNVTLLNAKDRFYNVFVVKSQFKLEKPKSKRLFQLKRDKISSEPSDLFKLFLFLTFFFMMYYFINNINILFALSLLLIKLVQRLFAFVSTNSLRVFITTPPDTTNGLELEAQATPMTNNFDIEIEIGLNNIIDYINGLTTIWLHSTSKADRLILDLPILNYCNCVELLLKYNKQTTNSSNNDCIKKDNENSQFHKCKCGKNNKTLLISIFAIKKIKFNECSICLDSYKPTNLICQLPCRHNFHKKCIYEWFITGNYQCPLCRQSAAKFNFKQ